MTGLLADPTLLGAFLASSFQLAVPLIFAALGAVFAERCGVFNIGLEGMILGGAFGAAVGADVFGSAFGGLAVGIGAGVALGASLALLAVTLKVNQLVIGIAINIMALGLTSFLSRIVFSAQSNTMNLPGFKTWAIPGLAGIPVVGAALFDQDVLAYSVYVIVPVGAWILFRTRWGLAVRAVGENPAAADTAGISVARVRWACVLASGALAGLGGCYLVLSQVYLFSENMSAGKGFIALAAMILGRWNPIGALFACLLFGFFDALQLRLQFMHPEVPYQMFVALPYVVSILAMVGLFGRPMPPRALGLAYDREAR